MLYRADDEPVVALLAAAPLLRDLDIDVDDGPDVHALEENLVALGYDDLTIDEHFDSDTAAAIKGWEEDLGRSDPDGAVSVGDVVFLPQPAAVLTHDKEIGDIVEPGNAVLTLGADSQVIDVDIDATTITNWKAGATVELVWGNGTASTGTVIDVGRDEVEGDVPVVIALTGQSTDWPIGTAVDIVRTTAQRTHVLAVPVAAIVEGPNGPAVRAVSAGDDHVVNVELGVVAAGWIEITDGIDPGVEVRLPG